MTDDFEDHCWKDIVTPDILEVYVGPELAGQEGELRSR
jgi:hypothetical protein